MSEGRLNGIKVLVTRPRARAEELCFLLEDEGADVSCLPLLELVPPEDMRPLRAAAERLQRYAWVVFASPSGVQALVEAAREAGTLEFLFRAKVACVGPRTAHTARDFGMHVMIQPEEATGKGLADALQHHVQSGEEILLPAAQDGRRELADALREQGHRVTHIAAYQSVRTSPAEAEVEALFASPPQVILFASPRTVEAFLELTGHRGEHLLKDGAKVIAIGPTTEAALEHLGFPPAAVAERPTSEGLVEAAIRAVRG